MDLWQLDKRFSKIEERLDKIEKTLFKKDFTENDYWKGDIPDGKFDEALNKYGYEYTPSSYPRTLDSYHAMEQDSHTAEKSYQEMIDAGYEMSGDGFWSIKEDDVDDVRSKIPDRY
tara:strand:+ start:377 stop:724 length:348 start_codon:yes stop_codon:yes gene_type:complete